MTREAIRIETERPVEVELKYRPSSLAAGERYLSMVEIAGLLPASRTRTTQHEDRYVDTADRALARAGFAARLRVSPESTIVSVKSTAQPADSGAHRREELEGPADLVSAPADWPASDARALVLELADDAPLVELVTIRQQRRRRRLSDGDTAVEVSLDEVEVVAGGETVDRFVELEVELLRGSEARLARVAEVLAEDPALTPSGISKLEAALSAVQAGAATAMPGSGAVGVDAEPSPPVVPLVAGKGPGVRADDALAEAGRKVLRFHFARMLARESGTRSGSDPEDLHSMRVATRRMRAAWRVFGDSFRRGQTKRHRAQLRELAGLLGAVRDLDVLIGGAEAWAREQPAGEGQALEPLLETWRGFRNDARVLLVRELDSDAHARFVEAFRVFVQTEATSVRPTGRTAPHHVRDTASSLVLAAYERVRAYEPVLRWADVETLHALRIGAKGLRYTLEFFREALGPDVALLLPRVVALQDHLGALHDADVAASMARSFLVERGADLDAAQAAAVERFLGSREREVGRLRGSVASTWRGVAGLAFRRRLGRAISAL